jgi:hypothetical protein
MKSETRKTIALRFWILFRNRSAEAMSVLRRVSSAASTSRTRRMTAVLPLRGGINFSIRSLKRINPTLSWFLIAESARRQVISAATSAFVRFPDPKQCERMPHSRRHVPVYRADIVAGHVLADFIEFHPLPFEHGVVFPGNALVNKAIGEHLDLPDLPHQFFCVNGHNDSQRVWLNY